MQGTIFDIQHFAVHDGPGIRTLVFLKGCPLECQWCCNPESQLKNPQLKFIGFRCRNCFSCIESCKFKAIAKNSENRISINFEVCKSCNSYDCIDACNNSALQIIGRTSDVNDVIKIISKDINFYRNSGGGVTFSGGEPLSQSDFLLELLKECKKLEIHTTIETSGYGKTEDYERIARYVDLFLFDLKIINDEKSKQFLGVSSKIIIENLKLLASLKKEIIIRIPLIPDLTDTNENLKDIVNLCKENNLKKINIEPYNSLGTTKYEEIGFNYKLSDKKEYNYGEIQNFIFFFNENGFDCELA